MISRKHLLAGISAIVLLAAPVVAHANSDESTPPVTSAQIDNAAHDVGNSAERVGHKIITLPGQAYRDFRHQLSSDNTSTTTADDLKSGAPITVDATHSARHIIGSDIRDNNNKVAGKVVDVTLDSKGAAEKLIVRDGGFFGMGGKLVALDYKALDRDDTTGDTFRTVDKSLLSNISAYDKSQDPSLHLADVLGASLKSPTQQSLGKVEDAVITHGSADELVLSFNQVLGLGGDKAVMSFNDANIINKGNSGTYVQLTAHQAETLSAMKSASK